MERMISNHKIQTALDEIKEISKIDLALYSEKGKQVAATFEPEGDMEEAVTSFVKWNIFFLQSHPQKMLIW